MITRSMADRVRETVQTNMVKTLMSTAPMLKELTPSAILRFVKGYDTFIVNLQRVAPGFTIAMQTYVKADVLYDLTVMHEVNATDEETVTAKLREIAEKYEGESKNTAREELLKLRWDRKAPIATVATKFVKDLLERTKLSNFTPGEQKALCREIVKKVPDGFFRNGREYAADAYSLTSFRNLVDYIKQIPEDTKKYQMKAVLAVDEPKKDRPTKEGSHTKTAADNQEPRRPRRGFRSRNNQEGRRAMERREPDNCQLTTREPYDRREEPREPETNRYNKREPEDPRPGRQGYPGRERKRYNEYRPWRRDYANNPRFPRAYPRNRARGENNEGRSSRREEPQVKQEAHAARQIRDTLNEDIEGLERAFEAMDNLSYEEIPEGNNVKDEPENLSLTAQIAIVLEKITVNANLAQAGKDKELVYKAKETRMNTWKLCDAELDSGSSRNIVSQPIHAEFLGKLEKTVSGSVTAAGGKTYQIVGDSYLDMKIEGDGQEVILNNVPVIVVDAPRWEYILLGARLLKKLGIAPRQALTKWWGKQIDCAKRDEKAHLVAAEERLSYQTQLPRKVCLEHPDLGRLTTNLEIGYGENVGDEGDELGYLGEAEVRQILSRQLDDAQTRELCNEAQRKEYWRLIETHLGVFGTKKSVAQMSNLDPMKVVVKPDATPVRERARKLSEKGKEVMRRKLQDLLRIGMISEARNPQWASPAFLIPKKNKKDFRMVIDMRQLNDRCEQTALTLPEIESQMSYLPAKIRYMASFDMLNGFDLLKTEKSSRQYFGISTLLGNYYLNGAPMGYKSTPAVYQNRIFRQVLGGIESDGVFSQPENGAMLWLDDLFIYGSTWKGFQGVLGTVFRNMQRYKVRFNAMKCELLQTEIIWCGRRINRMGWTFAAYHYQKVLNIPAPTNLKQLEKALYVITWLNVTIPAAAKIKAKLRELVTQVRQQYKILDRKARKSDERITLEKVWTKEHKTAWKS